MNAPSGGGMNDDAMPKSSGGGSMNDQKMPMPRK
jgi:hypothetical protein